MHDLAFLTIVAFVAGVMNAAAGGGTFVSVPALIATGVPSVAANMTSTVALCPGAFVSAWQFRHDLGPVNGVPLKVLLAISLTGGAVGALLLIFTPSRSFDFLIPWLMLTGSIAFAFGKQIGEFLRARMHLGVPALLVAQFLLGAYGGYFGAAVGLMMLAAWTIFGGTDVRTMVASRIIIVGLTNAVAIIFFLALGEIYWRQCMVMLVAGMAGGYAGARVARRLPIQQLRLGISCLNFALTAAIFWRAYA